VTAEILQISIKPTEITLKFERMAGLGSVASERFL
jgi:hypothetical protein